MPNRWFRMQKLFIKVILYLFRIAKSIYFACRILTWFLKMSKITRNMKRTWDYWATVEDLAKKFGISKRRVQQIIAKNIDVIEKAILIRHIDYGSNVWELVSVPIYRRINDGK